MISIIYSLQVCKSCRGLSFCSYNSKHTQLCAYISKWQSVFSPARQLNTLKIQYLNMMIKILWNFEILNNSIFEICNTTTCSWCTIINRSYTVSYKDDRSTNEFSYLAVNFSHSLRSSVSSSTWSVSKSKSTGQISPPLGNGLPVPDRNASVV